MASKKLLSISLGLILITAGWLIYSHYFTFDGTKRIEAEDGNLTYPMKVVHHNDSSGGAYIMTPTGHKGTASYTFNVPEDGIYKITARVQGRNGEHNSFFYKIDDGKEKLWDVHRNSPRARWRNEDVNERTGGSSHRPTQKSFTTELESGIHTLTFRGRENDTRLDYFAFELVKPLAAAPFLPNVNIDRALNQVALSCLIILLILTIAYLVKYPAIFQRKATYEKRIAALEKRFTDIQDVVISLDEQLKRLEKQNTEEELELKV